MIYIGGTPTIKFDRETMTAEVTGQALMFTKEGEARDLDGQYFDDSTDYGYTESNNHVATLNHRVPIKTGNHQADVELARLASSKFDHPVKLTREPWGFLFEHVLNLANDFEKWVADVIKSGGFKLSTGALAHMFEVTDKGHIKSWHVGEVAYTPTPAEPRLSKVQLKSVLSDTAGWLYSPAKEEAKMPQDEKTATRPITDADVEAYLAKKAAEQKQDELFEKVESQEEQLAHLKATNDKLEKDLAELKSAYERTPMYSGIVSIENAQKASDFNTQFAKWVRGGKNKEEWVFGPEDTETKAWQQDYKQAKGNTKAMKLNLTTGAPAVPEGHYGQIVGRRDQEALYNRIGIRIVTGVGEDLKIPIQDADTALFVNVADDAQGGDNDPTLNEVTMTMGLYRRNIRLTWGLMHDEDASLMAYIAEEVGRSLGLTHNSLLAAEIDTGTNITTTAASPTAFTAPEIQQHPYTLKEGYAQNAIWMMARATHGTIRAIQGDDFNFPLFGVGPQLVGHDVSDNSFMPAPASSTKPAVIFDPWYVGLRMAPDLRVIRDETSEAANGRMVLWYYSRLVYKIIQQEGLALFQMGV